MSKPDLTAEEIADWKRCMLLWDQFEDSDIIKRCTEFIRRLLTAYEQVVQDIDAYRGVLGYAVPGTYDGRLHDGTTPNNGLAEALTAQVQAWEIEDSACRAVLRTYNITEKRCLHDMVVAFGIKYETCVTDLSRECTAWKHAAEQASGMHMAENILSERDEMKIKLRKCEEGRAQLEKMLADSCDALKAELLAWKKAAAGRVTGTVKED